MTTAFVLGGGGLLGAHEVGMLRALSEAGGLACRFHDTNSVHSAVIRGVSKLQGADVTMPDVRAGFSAVLAAAVADRPSVLRGIHHIERGYHRPFEQFASLGLTIRRG